MSNKKDALSEVIPTSEGGSDPAKGSVASTGNVRTVNGSNPGNAASQRLPIVIPNNSPFSAITPTSSTTSIINETLSNAGSAVSTANEEESPVQKIVTTQGFGVGNSKKKAIVPTTINPITSTSSTKPPVADTVVIKQNKPSALVTKTVNTITSTSSTKPPVADTVVVKQNKPSALVTKTVNTITSTSSNIVPNPITSTSSNKPKTPVVKTVEQDKSKALVADTVDFNSTNPKGLAGTIPISIFGDVYNIGFSELDTMRRRSYFRDDASSSLTSEEQRLLDALQITKPLEIRFRPYIANFFENLQSCNTDTSVLLRNKCQSTQLLLWNIHFAIQSYKNVSSKVAQSLKKPYSSEGAALNAAIVNALKKKSDDEDDDGGQSPHPPAPPAPPAPHVKPKMTREECLRQLFTWA